MKKILLVVISMVLILGLIFAACTKPASAPKEQPTTPSEQASQPKGDVVKCTISLPGPMFPESTDALAVMPFIEVLYANVEMNPAFKDKFELKIIDNAQLYGIQEQQTALASGAVQVGYGTPHHFEQWNPAWKLLEAPGVIESWDHMQRVLQTEPFQELAKDLASKGTTILTWAGSVGNTYFFTPKPVDTMEGLKGLKMRYYGGEGQAKALAGLGVNPTFIPATEVVTALQTKQVDSFVTDLGAALFFYEAPKYCPNMMPYVIAIQPIALTCNTKWLESLPATKSMTNPGIREYFDDPIYGIFKRVHTYPYFKGLDDMLVMAWKGNGLYVSPYSEAEAKKIRDAMVKGQESMLTGIDPKYMKAIDSVR